MLLFLFDLPVNQKRQRRPQGDDSGYDSDFLPVADNYGTQDLASQLELQAHGQAFGQSQLCVRRTADIQENPPDAGEDDDSHPDKLKKKYGSVYNVFQNNMKHVQHICLYPPSFLISDKSSILAFHRYVKGCLYFFKISFIDNRTLSY